MGGGSMCFTNPQGSYTSSYQAALAANQQNYNNIISGYQTLAGQQTGEFNQLLGGYSALCGRVQCTIKGVECAQLTAAKGVFTQNAGNIQNQMISGGLNVSSVLCSAARGNAACYAKAQCQARSSFAQLQAGYQSQIGLGALNAQQQGIMANTALGAQQLAFMGHCVNIPYPCASLYAKQANAMRMQGAGGGGGAGMGTPNMPRGIATPPKPNNPAGCQYGSGGGGGGGGIYGTCFCRPNPLICQTNANNNQIMQLSNSLMSGSGSNPQTTNIFGVPVNSSTYGNYNYNPPPAPDISNPYGASSGIGYGGGGSLASIMSGIAGQGAMGYGGGDYGDYGGGGGCC
jgi:hypothetical protein